MHDQTTGAVAIKTANVVTQAAAAGTVYFGLTLNEIGVIVGIAVGVIGLIGQLGLTWYYKHQHLQLAPYFRAAGFDVFARRYGWAFASPAILPGLVNWQNERRAKRLAETIADGDAIVCHSNGAAVAYCIQADHRELSALILINPALDRDTDFHNVERVLCLHNAGDDVVGLSAALPFNHWGMMGRDGYAGSLANVVNVNCAEPPDGLPKLWGHSALFEPETLPHWGPALAREMQVMLNKE